MSDDVEKIEAALDVLATREVYLKRTTKVNISMQSTMYQLYSSTSNYRVK